MPLSVPETPAAWGEPLFCAQFKMEPADFQVSEVLEIEFDGQGEHLYLHIEKTSVNTDEIVDLLAKSFQVDSKAIGFAGMKDRHAVTTQWFSVATPLNEDQFIALLPEFCTGGKSARLLEVHRHSRKLRRGAHSANKFVVTLKNIEPLLDDSSSVFRSAINNRIASIGQFGFPNYIGPQRFGFGGQNFSRARQWFRQPKKRASRQQRSLWLSAARSAVFNQVCAQRVRSDNWKQLLDGEPAVLDGSKSFFDSGTSTKSELESRIAAFDIHTSAPWWGRGATPAKSDCLEFENAALSEFAEVLTGLEKAGLAQERRALRARALELQARWVNDSTLELSFLLSPGVFATTLLCELGVCREPDRRQST
ncbi:MAG: tRNA pseudouridine(13) synthase TruD [Granulosicoccus sp.]